VHGWLVQDIQHHTTNTSWLSVITDLAHHVDSCLVCCVLVAWVWVWVGGVQQVEARGGRCGVPGHTAQEPQRYRQSVPLTFAHPGVQRLCGRWQQHRGSTPQVRATPHCSIPLPAWQRPTQRRRTSERPRVLPPLSRAPAPVPGCGWARCSRARHHLQRQQLAAERASAANIGGAFVGS
jgi:hypothetical protein